MNKYETIMIINSTLDEAATKATIDKFLALIGEHGTVESTEEWGKRKLAYPIQKQNEGYYTLQVTQNLLMNQKEFITSQTKL